MNCENCGKECNETSKVYMHSGDTVPDRILSEIELMIGPCCFRKLMNIGAIRAEWPFKEAFS